MPRRYRSSHPLRNLELFVDAKAAEVERAASLLTMVSVDAGQVLLRQGTGRDQFLIVANGVVGVSRADEVVAEVIAMANPGDVLGEMSLLHHTTKSATATALVPTTLYVASNRDFFRLLDAVPSAAERIVELANVRRGQNDAA
jgi:CRP-like cAMP-binding protein